MFRNLVLIIALFSTSHLLAGEIQRSDDPVQGQYIVLLADQAVSQVRSGNRAELRQTVDLTANFIASQYRGEVKYIYADAMHGFAVRMSDRSARLMANDPLVSAVVEDQWAYGASTSGQFNPPWGLDRIDQREPTLDGIYNYLDDLDQGSVHVYVVDSGIYGKHTEFGGRVDSSNAFNAIDDDYGFEGCNGHGTHVAGTIGGENFGVAKQVSLHSVRVLDCWNQGPMSAVIAGIDWITARVIDRPHPAVANVSLTTNGSDVLDNAIRASMDAGVTYVVSAGNADTDACQFSPARMRSVITVGASNRLNAYVPGTNTGPCVNIVAPGENIRSAFNDHEFGEASMTGTSPAAAHVTGIAALLLAQEPDSTPGMISDLIIAHATVLEQDIESNTHPLLAFSLIDLHPEIEPEPIAVSFASDCNLSTKYCEFTAKVKGPVDLIEELNWSFGSSQVLEQTGWYATYQFPSHVRSAVVILEAVLSDGRIIVAEKTIYFGFSSRPKKS